MNAETINALTELVQTVGLFVAFVLVAGIGLGYLAKRLIDRGYELHLKPSGKRRD